MAEEAHDRRDEDETGDDGEQNDADRKLDLPEALEHGDNPLRAEPAGTGPARCVDY
jgi:hypothetical protein